MEPLPIFEGEAGPYFFESIVLKSLIYLEELSFEVVSVISIIIFSNFLIRNSHLHSWCIYIQSPDAKTIILSCQTVCANISDISDSQMNMLSNYNVRQSVLTNQG